MPYTPTTWVNGTAPALNATDLNHIEAGVESANANYYSVQDYGAKFDGATNDTAAHQAAIDAASAGQGTVTMPPGISRFSNLKVTANMRFVGSGMNETILQRIPGSTGTAIREKTSGEGNPSGATGLWMSDFMVDGNSTTGDGLDIGNQVGGAQLNFNAGLSNIHSRSFTSGTGIRVRGNAVQCRYLWANLNSIGIETQGGGNGWYDLMAEGNTTRDLLLNTSGDSYYHLQVETNPATIPIEIGSVGSQNSIFGVYVALAGNVTTIIKLTTGCARNSLYDVFVDDAGGAHTFSQVILSESQSTGTGSTQYRFPAFLQTDGHPMWVYDQTSNIRMKISGTGIDSDPRYFASIGANGEMALVAAAHLQGLTVATPITFATEAPTITTDASNGSFVNVPIHSASAFTMANPTNPANGQRLVYDFQNLSGGAMGTVTWDTQFKLAGALTNPANGKRREIEFIYDNAASWVELSRSVGDI